jgi:hypothetical protein
VQAAVVGQRLGAQQLYSCCSATARADAEQKIRRVLVEDSAVELEPCAGVLWRAEDNQEG